MTTDIAPAGIGVRLRGWRLGGVIVVIVAALHVPMFTAGMVESDEAYIATVAQVMSDGGELYVDAVDRKPPLVFLAYQSAFAVTGSSEMWGPRILGLICLAATAGLVAMFARRRFGDRAAVIAGVLAALSTATLLPRDAQAANFEVFMLPGIAAAMVLADRRRLGWAGLALGVTTCAKQTALATLLPLAWMAFSQRRVRGLVVLAAGTLVPLVFAAVWFGPRNFVFWVFTSNEGYLDAGGAWGYVAREALRMTLSVAVLNVALLALLPVAWRRHRANVDVWLWLASGVVGVVAGLRFFGHYYWQVLPPLCVLAAGALVSLRPRFTAATVAVMTTTALVGSALLIDADARPSRTWVPIAEYVEDHTAADDRIFIWGHVPEIYWDAQRRPGARFLTTGFLTGHSGGRPPDLVGIDRAVDGAWDDFMSDLESDPPAMILVMTDSGIRSAQHYPPEDFPRFDEYLRDNYERVDTVHGVDVYEPR